jgi:dihydrofolate reductase
VKASVFIATSLDGFIARRNGDIDWLVDADSSEKNEDYGWKVFWDSVDCLIMGRNTMEKVVTFGEWPYEGKRVVVLSNTLSEPPSMLAGKVELYSGSPRSLVDKLEHEGCEHLYVDGGKVIQSFINENLITDITINRIPILLGEGLPLFGPTNNDIKLKHIQTETYPNGFVMSQYTI